MTRMSVLFTLVIGISGCGDDSASTDSGTTDMSVSHDQSVSPDMASTADMNFPRITITGTITKQGTMPLAPLAGVQVCVYPSTTGCATTAADGTYSLMVPATGPSGVTFTLNGYVPVLQEITPPEPIGVDFQLIPAATAGILATLLHISLDETKGLFATIAVDPGTGMPLSGVSFTVTPAPGAGTGPYYVSGGFPDPQATATSADGSALYLNVPVGDYTVTATLAGKVCGPLPPRAWVKDQLTAKATAVAGVLTGFSFACQAP